MTITLQVRDVLKAPQPFEKRFRLVVDGVLWLDDTVFSIFQSDDSGGWVDDLSLAIEDDEAKKKTRAALAAHNKTPADTASTIHFIGQAWVEAWTNIKPHGVVLYDVVNIYLGDDISSAVHVPVRPHPWGWDR